MKRSELPGRAQRAPRVCADLMGSDSGVVRHPRRWGRANPLVDRLPAPGPAAASL